MNTETKGRFDGPHLSVARRTRLRRTIREVDQTVDDLLRVETAFMKRPNAETAERIGILSEAAWALLFPYRRQLLQINVGLLRRYRDAVDRLHSFLHEQEDMDLPKQTLRMDLADRLLMLDAILDVNGEARLRELLMSKKSSVAGGGQ